MSFEADLRSHLGSAGIVALVADRITPVVRQEGVTTLPALTYQLIGVDPVNNLDGIDGSLRAIRVQIDAWARSHSDAMALATAVRDRMNADASTFTTEVETAFLDLYEPDAKLYRRMQEFTCWFRET